jgi:cold shock CspA family protein
MQYLSYANVRGRLKFFNPVWKFGFITIDGAQPALADGDCTALKRLGRDVKLDQANLGGIKRMFPGQPLRFDMSVTAGEPAVTRPVTMVGEPLTAMNIDFMLVAERPGSVDDVLFDQSVKVKTTSLRGFAFVSVPADAAGGKEAEAFVPISVLDTFGLLHLRDGRRFPEPVDIWLTAPRGPRVLPRGLAAYLFPNQPPTPLCRPKDHAGRPQPG